MRKISMLALVGALAALGVGGVASPAAADVLLGVDITPSSLTNLCAPTLECNSFLTYGYQFTTGSSPVVVVGLGTFDNGSLTNLNDGEQVNLWNHDGSSVVAGPVTVNASSAQVGLWAFTALPTPVTLAPDTAYVVGSQGDGAFVAGSLDPNFLDISVNPTITYNGGRSSSAESFEFPGLVNATSFNPGFFGGNIEIDPVPEPMSLSLFGAALAGFGLLRRRKKA